MKGLRRKHRGFSGFLAMLLAVVLIVTLPLPFLPHRTAEARSGGITNVVIFVRRKSDTNEIFKATKESNAGAANWQEVKKMYDQGNGLNYNNSFANYISVISQGKLTVTNYFPQECSDKPGVDVFTLSSDSEYGGPSLVAEVIEAINNGTIKLDTQNYILDQNGDGNIDNLTIVLQSNTGSDNTSADGTAYHTNYSGSEMITVNNTKLRVWDYNVIPSNTLLDREQGVIAHEFLHSLGLPDLYRTNLPGQPVGRWDIMSSVQNSFLVYPLSYFRARLGWVSMGTITQSGTYTLKAVSESGGNQVYKLSTPLSDTEFICLEYRRQKDEISQVDHRIPSSGLLMYRVDTKVEKLDNRAGKNGIYVYRPGVTDPEAATDIGGTYNMNLSEQAALSPVKGSTYGTTDLNADFTKNTLYYSDGSNSGIQISVVSADEKEITFTVTFADYKSAISWENVGDVVSDQCIGQPFVCADPSTGTLYAAFMENMTTSGTYRQVCVKRWDGATWQQVGTKLSPVAIASEPALAFCGGALYLSYQDQSGQPVYCKLENGSWKQVARHNVSYPGYMQFVTDGNNLYAAYAEGSSSQTWTIYNLTTGSLVDKSLTAGNFSNPAMLAADGSLYMTYADFGGGTKIQKYSNGTWTTVHSFSGQYTNTHHMAKYGNQIYAFAYGTTDTKGSGTIAIFDGSTWTNHAISQLDHAYSPSMAMSGNQVCLAYYDTGDKKTKLLQGTGAAFQTIADNLGTGLIYLHVCTYGSNLYIASMAENSTNLVVRKKVIAGGGGTPPVVNPPVSQEARLLTVTPPTGYADNHIYIDGIEYTATKSGSNYQLKLPDTFGKTAVMYAYNERNIPVGMYVWKLSWEGESCKAIPMPGLENLLSYHGFSIRVQGKAGIRFKSGIDAGLKRQLIAGNVDGCRLKEYGTLFITNENRAKYPFIKGGEKVGGGRAYWTENGKVTDRVFETVAGRNRFTSVLTNLLPNMYAKDIAFRAYVVVECGGQDMIIYGPPVYRSVYTVAKQVQANKEFKPGSSAYRYVQGLIDSVEKK